MLDGQLRAVVNINTLDQGQALEFEYSGCDFDGEQMSQRLERRRGNWIGQVRLTQF
jgi:hypothetical protein